MKYIGYGVRLLLPLAAIVLLTLSMLDVSPTPQLFLMSGQLCSCVGLWFNIYVQQKQRKQKEAAS